eukprot:IDg826t1
MKIFQTRLSTASRKVFGTAAALEASLHISSSRFGILCPLISLLYLEIKDTQERVGGDTMSVSRIVSTRLPIIPRRQHPLIYAFFRVRNIDYGTDYKVRISQDSSFLLKMQNLQDGLTASDSSLRDELSLRKEHESPGSTSPQALEMQTAALTQLLPVMIAAGGASALLRFAAMLESFVFKESTNFGLKGTKDIYHTHSAIHKLFQES